jgi:hypothetical protein
MASMPNKIMVLLHDVSNSLPLKKIKESMTRLITRVLKKLAQSEIFTLFDLTQLVKVG